ncbi:hypothetical protein AN958_03079 [Leucoagaricus sp. SymC.cos]|nr:hypothetical protein AN958_03079 [Leucoagaricus sp. SymC.cos]
MSSLDLDAETNFNLSFPLPYRVLVLIGLGIFAWATNLHGLHVLGIDAVGALELRTEGQIPRTPSHSNRLNLQSKHVSPSVVYLPTYSLFFTYGAFCFISWTLYRVCTKGNDVLIDAFGYIPLTTGLIILMVLVCPMNIVFKYERDKFLRALYRCLLSPYHAPVRFSDVVFADIVTSFAKVLGDVWLSLVMLLPGNTVLAGPAEVGWHRWILPAIMSFPYLVRFRQCVIEYAQPSGSSRRPLYNAIKYATAFPVIFLSAAQKSAPEDDSILQTTFEPQWHGMFRLWLLSAAINSTYSFWWDITNDWGLELLTPGPGQRSYPWGLRPMLLYPLPIYPLLVFLNLILRMTWSIKLSSHLYSVGDGGVGIFWLEVAEIVRRWLWVFLRVEWEVIKKLHDGNPKGRPDDFNFSSGGDYEMVPTTPEEHLLLNP